MPSLSITWGDLWRIIRDAAAAALGTQPAKVKDFLEAESRKFAVTLEMVANGLAAGTISKTEAQIVINSQRVAAQAVLTAVEGMTAVMAQSAISAAFAAIHDFFKSKTGIDL